jgi:hypothetical protein
MITQRAKWISDSPSSPPSVFGRARANMNRKRLTQLIRFFCGVSTFIA